MNKNIKEKIIYAIQKQCDVDVQYRKEGDYAIEQIAVSPYDVYPVKTKKSVIERDVLLGFRTDNLLEKGNHILKIYLDNIVKLEVMENEKFVGTALRELIKPKREPYIKREW